MFATFRMEAPLPFQSRSQTPLYTESEVQAFVERLEPPRALRDPVTQSLLRRPVASLTARNEIENICVDEVTLRRMVLEGREHHNGRAAFTPQQGPRAILHRPMCRQLSSFYEAALARSLLINGAQSERHQAMSRFVDAASYELRQPVVPILFGSEQADRALEALQPLNHAAAIVNLMRGRVEHLLSRITQPDLQFERAERTHKALLIDMQILRTHMRDSRRLLWQVMIPPTQMPPSFFSQWRSIYAELETSRATYEEVLWVEVPATLAAQAHAQAEASKLFLQGNAASRSSSP